MNKPVKPTQRKPLDFDVFADFFGMVSGNGVLNLMIGKTMAMDNREFIGVITVLPQTMVALKQLADAFIKQYKKQTGIDLEKKVKNTEHEIQIPKLNGDVNIQ